MVPIVSSGRAANIISKRWSEKYKYLPDAIVVEGPPAGGHLGFKIDSRKEDIVIINRRCNHERNGFRFFPNFARYKYEVMDVENNQAIYQPGESISGEISPGDR